MKKRVAQLLFLGTLGCTSNKTPQEPSEEPSGEPAGEPSDEPPRPPDFTVSAGVESATVLDADPFAPLTLYNSDGDAMVTLIADELGQAHFAYIGGEHVVLDPNNFEGFSMADGTVLAAGEGYFIQDDSVDPPDWSGAFSVLAVDDVPEESFYEQQELLGIHVSPITGELDDPEIGYQYIEVRDGILLSAMIRFPDNTIYGEGPYPTIIEYSGYAPSRHDQMDVATRIGNSLGYATVSVNMRGTGCSGGVFDVFNRAQHADGYDLVEIVARQDWVLNNQVGMVGLSYPGISQLYVGSTNPPSLAAIVPLSTIADAWEMQWPGGIYNKGFTRQWVNARDAQAQAGGSSWVDNRIANGDSVCEENLRLSSHSVDFESFLRAMDVRPPDADARDLNLLVEQIEAPVFYGGSFQDEQTGAQFGEMLGSFDNARHLKVHLTNGRHPDGYSPNIVFYWFEFLEFYLSERIPVLNPLVRAFGATEFGNIFGMTEFSFIEDRFSSFEDYEEALEAYEEEASVRVLFEFGAGSEQAGAPVASFESFYDGWPPVEAQPIEWFFGSEGQLQDSLPSDSGIDAWTFDQEASEKTFFGPAGYQLLVPLWDIDWTPFAAGNIVSYSTDPFSSPMVVSGPGIVDLWIRSPVEDVMVQVTLTEIRPDGMEVLIQSGWLNLSHRASREDEGLRLHRTYSLEDFEPMPIDEWVSSKIVIPSVAHPIRAGSALRVSVSSPGRDHGTWEFETPEYADNPTFQLGYGSLYPSSLRMMVLPDIEIPEAYPPCPSLRGQPCRAYEPESNETVE